MNTLNYEANYIIMENVSNNSFRLHNHDNYEIYMFVEGDTNYVVESDSYKLEPYDIIIIRKHQMHRAYQNSSARYRRYILMIDPEFFIENNCKEYEKAFLENNNISNKISGELVRSSGLYEAIMRFQKYSDDFKNQNTPICRAIIMEILYLINNISSFAAADASSKQLKAIISHINNTYTENISLDDLEKEFYISKYHLCHIFKQATGLTVHKYITHKRLTKARELVDEGYNLSSAAMLSGFGNYSSFYRAYIAKYKTPPKEKNTIL